MRLVYDNAKWCLRRCVSPRINLVCVNFHRVKYRQPVVNIVLKHLFVFGFGLCVMVSRQFCSSGRTSPLKIVEVYVVSRGVCKTKALWTYSGPCGRNYSGRPCGRNYSGPPCGRGAGVTYSGLFLVGVTEGTIVTGVAAGVIWGLCYGGMFLFGWSYSGRDFGLSYSGRLCGRSYGGRRLG